jgi:hypothetical protein
MLFGFGSPDACFVGDSLRSVGSILNKIVTFFINSDGDELYMKIINFVKVNNFVVQTVFI